MATSGLTYLRLERTSLGNGGVAALAEEIRLGTGSTRLKVLYLSGQATDIAPGGIVPEDGHALLRKPFSPAQLARRVREILDGDEEAAEEA